MPRALITLELPGSLQSALAAGHPWVYRDHVPHDFRAPAGTWIHVRAGRWRGYAVWDPQSAIALRVYSSSELPDAEWVKRRVWDAWELRSDVRRETDAFRWLFGEGDGLPGITVDVYGGFAVLVTYATGLDALVPWVVEALRAVGDLDGIVRRARPGAGGERIELVWGRAPPERMIVSECGVKMGVDLRHGQKTGLFLDHRENRRWVGEHASGRKVLNLFAYTGAFSLHALRGGAKRVTNVDVAADALVAARDNCRLNGFEVNEADFVAADAFEYLEKRQRGEGFELVVCDPPSFANSRAQLDAARQAYVRLNALAMKAVAPGGWLATASCTAQLTPAAFRDAIAEAAVRSRRRVQLVHEAGHALDHPVSAGHPEGRYLKFVVGRVVAVV
ncbi:MAG: class I SAM-dependent rRNA methyltransferase [Polyangiaceae bacterium]|nr:class I SAM-dependent rRNA methyltransferase [Polyangiaceae bacterium]